MGPRSRNRKMEPRGLGGQWGMGGGGGGELSPQLGPGTRCRADSGAVLGQVGPCVDRTGRGRSGSAEGTPPFEGQQMQRAPETEQRTPKSTGLIGR